MTNSATEEVQKHIKLILSETRPGEPSYPRRGTTTKLLDPGDPPTKMDPPYIVTDPKEVEMTQEQVGLLKILYGQCSPELKSSFPALLLAEATERNVSIVVLTLLETGHLSEVMETLLNKMPAGGLSLRRLTWKALRGILVFQSHRFTDDDLTKLEDLRKRDASWSRITEKKEVASLRQIH